MSTDTTRVELANSERELSRGEQGENVEFSGGSDRGWEKQRRTGRVASVTVRAGGRTGVYPGLSLWSRVATRFGALLSLLTIVGLVFGVPIALAVFVGWPLPDHVPTADQLRDAFERQGVPLEVIINSLAIVVWIAWAQLAWALGAETMALMQGRIARNARVWPGAQLIARNLVASAALVMSSLGGVRMAAAAPLTALQEIEPPEDPALRAADPGFVVPPAPPPPTTGDASATTTTSPPTTTTSTTAPATTTTTDTPAAARATTSAAAATSAPTSRATTPTIRNEQIYEVQRGDTFWGLAEKHLGSGMRWREIRDRNAGRAVAAGRTLSRTDDRLDVGWRLILPATATTGAAAPQLTEPLTAPASAAPPGTELAELADAEIETFVGDVGNQPPDDSVDEVPPVDDARATSADSDSGATRADQGDRSDAEAEADAEATTSEVGDSVASRPGSQDDAAAAAEHKPREQPVADDEVEAPPTTRTTPTTVDPILVVTANDAAHQSANGGRNREPATTGAAPTAGRPSAEARAEAEAEAASTASSSQPVGTLTVRPGDHFWGLAERQLEAAWGRPVTAAEVAPYWRMLIDANQSRISSGNPNIIFPGQTFTAPDTPTPPPGAPGPGQGQPGQGQQGRNGQGINPPGPPDTTPAEEPPPTTAPPTTEAPDTEPATTAPPTTQAPTTEAPTTAPPTTRPPTTRPPATTPTTKAGGVVIPPGGGSPTTAPPATVLPGGGTTAPGTPTTKANSPSTTENPPETTAPEDQGDEGASGEHGDDDSGIPLPLVAGTAALAGLVLVALARRRRARSRSIRPGGYVEPRLVSDILTERNLAVAAGDVLDVVWATSRALGAVLAVKDDLPAVTAVVVAPNRAVTVYFAEPCDPAPPFEVGAATDRWQLYLDDLDEVDLVSGPEPAVAVLDTLAVVGKTDADEWLFVDLESLGAVELAGDPTVAAELAQSIVTELSLQPASDHLVDLTVIGIDELAPSVAEQGVINVTGLDQDLVRRFEQSADETSGFLDLQGLRSTVAARAKGMARDGLFVTVVAYGGATPADPVLLERLASAATPGGRGVAVLAFGPLGSGATRIIVTDDGRAHIPRLGITVNAARLEGHDVYRVSELLRNEPEDMPREPQREWVVPGAGERARDTVQPGPPRYEPIPPIVDPEIAAAYSDTGEPAEVGRPADFAVDVVPDYLEPPWRYCVRIFADHMVETPEGELISFRYGENPDVPNKNTHRGPELLSYLALSGRAASATDVRDHLWWDRPVALGTVNKLLYGTRKVLGGADLLSLAQDDPVGRYRLSPEVVTDVELLAHALQHAHAIAQMYPDVALAVLRGHLARIEAVAFRSSHLGQGLAEWAAAYRVVDRVEQPVIDAALLVAKLSTDRGPDGYEDALWAVDQGLFACPVNEALVRAAMEIEARLGSPEAVNARYLTLAAKLARDELEPEPETMDLRARLGGGKPGRGPIR